MSHRFSALLAALLLAAGGALTWTARPDRDVNMSAVGELWADIFRDADSFGLQLTRVSAREEMDLGRRIAARIVRANTTVPMWEVYVNTVGQSVARHAGRKDIRYEFHVIAAPARNAFSLPGGQIFLYTGLLEQMKTEAELAGVLGHEIAHVDRRHCIERFQYRMRLRKLGLDDIGPLVQIGRSLLTVGYSQYQELEADSEGLRMSLAEGYDPNGVIDLFARLFAGSGRHGIRAPRSRRWRAWPDPSSRTISAPIPPPPSACAGSRRLSAPTPASASTGASKICAGRLPGSGRNFPANSSACRPQSLIRKISGRTSSYGVHSQ